MGPWAGGGVVGPAGFGVLVGEADAGLAELGGAAESTGGAVAVAAAAVVFDGGATSESGALVVDWTAASSWVGV
ncbi:hypothetical protein GV794_28740 [Nocardia cyriacigeorgica]|uniref:Uncharacterized protein n=1 Tax=Nocardia cyriacigeorgica TaxID=135487 RepID=A0A6P1DCX1_9NOCA|nr:hypothetical protein [Nocardia cyriacigeorgica]NEW48337.1 hypothetical protein [Nocardia cyriacigeorgica]NEW54013.1 hypothetical protein [Nocardia cyriacigeorgica]NEW59581.1 hypothetical protein [Nocardia cyriacigeorgica]